MADMHSSAANAQTFLTATCNDPAFLSWVTRVLMRLRNLPPDSPEQIMRATIVKEGLPSREWVAAFDLLKSLAHK